MTPADPAPEAAAEVTVPGSPRLAVLAWWGILISPPVIPLVMWLRSPLGTLHRGHAKAAMTLWASMFVLWVPLALWSLADEAAADAAAIGVAVALGLTVAGCAWGTGLALRGVLPPGGVDRWAGTRPSAKMGR